MVPAMYIAMVLLIILVVLVAMVGMIAIPWLAFTGGFDKELDISSEMADGAHKGASVTR